jgi:hypothetical protein
VFFAELPRSGNYFKPLFFGVACYGTGVLLQNLLLPSETDTGVMANIATSAFAGPVGFLIGAVIIHLLVMLFAGRRNAGFEATFRVVSYSQVSNLVSWIPWIGWVLSLWGLYLSYVGIREMHRLTKAKAALIVLTPAAVIFAVVIIIILALVMPELLVV